MDYHKIHHPHHFSFASQCRDGVLDFGVASAVATVTDHGDNVFHLQLSGDRWGPHQGLNSLTPPTNAAPSDHQLLLTDEGALQLINQSGQAVLAGHGGSSLGIAARRWLIEFAYDPAFKFYGLGEKTGALEKTGLRTKFWNTDVWADFPWEQIRDGRTDPMYVSIPYTAIRTPHGWVGILIDDPYPSFLSCGGQIGAIANQQGVTTNTRFYFGAEDGAPSVWLIAAESLTELTARYQRLVGTTPLPPLWALGHHQCRWGYATPDDLAWVKRGMAEHGIPNSGLWLDIEYMDGYRVFTWDPNEWTDLANQLAELQADGQRVVPILDPGVKRDPGYRVHDEGNAADIWCTTEDRVPYIGYVWPGETLFPDYLTDSGRSWWQDEVQAFASAGIHAAWCDMNDPAVGPVELEPMRFDHGTLEHAIGHNQYGAQMARATRAGLQAAHPEQRPFVLGRSGYTGCQQHTALWTGDNLSNWTYLSGSIPCSLNLAMSGVPLNGPDVPGFGEDASEGLALRWYQVGFLFPFLRNHCVKSQRSQEPFTFTPATRNAITRLIRLRYRLLPYLYQLWIDHEQTGAPVMRPMLMAEDDERFVETGDQFLIGPDLLQAPLVAPATSQRSVSLPQGTWFDLRTGEWLDGSSYHELDLDHTHTPLYARGGSVIPMQAVDPTDHHIDLATVDLHCVLQPGHSAEVVYHADDGDSWRYRDGERTTWRATITAHDDHLEVSDICVSNGWQPLSIRLVSYANHQRVTSPAGSHATKPLTLPATGDDLTLTVAPLPT